MDWFTWSDLLSSYPQSYLQLHVQRAKQSYNLNKTLDFWTTDGCCLPLSTGGNSQNYKRKQSDLLCHVIKKQKLNNSQYSLQRTFVVTTPLEGDAFEADHDKWWSVLKDSTLKGPRYNCISHLDKMRNYRAAIKDWSAYFDTESARVKQKLKLTE